MQDVKGLMCAEADSSVDRPLAQAALYKSSWISTKLTGRWQSHPVELQ